jgi:phosphatidylglycerol---prolipoprotein diacylglyceryl transferase
MHKVLFHIPLSDFLAKLLNTNTITVYTYAFCVVLGALICCWFIKKSAKKHLQVQLQNSFFYQSFIAGFIGGKLLFYLEKPTYYFSNPSLMLNNFSGGFVCYGSVIAVSLFAAYYARKNKIAVLGLLDVLSIYTVLPIAFGRIGCFFNGCCYGKATTSFMGLIFPSTNNIAVHPTQLYEAVLMIFILVCLLQMNKYKKWQGQVFVLNLSLYAIGRALIEILRGDIRGFLFNNFLSQAQFIACLMLIVSATIFIIQNKKYKTI